MKSYLNLSLSVLFFVLCGLVSTPALSQSNMNLEREIEATLSGLETQADSSSKTTKEQELRAALQLLENARELEAEAQSYKLAAEGEDATVAALNEQLEALETSQVQDLPGTVEARPQQLNQSESELLEKRNALDQLDAKKTYRPIVQTLFQRNFFGYRLSGTKTQMQLRAKTPSKI